METTTPEKNMPFRVVTNGGNMVKGFENLNAATQNADNRNERAEELGIETRYLAKPQSAA